MSTTNKNKKITVSEALLEMDKVSKALKEESKNTLSTMLAEAVKNYIKEEISEDEEKEEEYSIEDDTVENDVDGDDASNDEEDAEKVDAEESDSNKEEMDEPAEGEDDEWSEFDDFKSGDDVYDFTSGEKDDMDVVKVYKLLKDTDQVVVKQNGDDIELKDNETGVEYVIKLDADDENDMEMEFEIESDNNDEEGNVMESKEMVFEVDLGYTDNYQDKDPIAGLSNNEPSKSGKSWDAGVPKDAKKPWAGNAQAKGKPYGEVSEDIDLGAAPAVNDEEVVDEATTHTLPNARAMRKAHLPQNQKTPNNRHVVSKEGEYVGHDDSVNETIKRLQKENKEMKAMIPQIKKAMNESVLVNYKLGRIVKLFSENTTTSKEKLDIINRFNEEANTINETKALYESVKRELNATAKKPAIIESSVTATEKPKVNETTVYQSNEIKEMLNFMNRMNKC